MVVMWTGLATTIVSVWGAKGKRTMHIFRSKNAMEIPRVMLDDASQLQVTSEILKEQEPDQIWSRRVT